MGNWLRDALLKKWCEDNGIKVKEIDMNGMDAKAFFDDWREGLNKEEKDMTKGARVIIKRICDELMKWCEERHVMCEFATTDDEGLSATFMVGGTTLSVSHIELRDADEFSRYVKNVLFGIDESAVIDKLKEEINKKDEFIVRLQNELVNEDRKSLYGQIGELEEELESKDAYIGRLEREDKEKAKDIEYLENKVKGLEQELKKKDEELEHLDGKLKEAVDKRVYVNSDNIVLRAKVNDLNNVIDDRDAYIEELRKELEKKDEEIKELAKTYNNREIEICDAEVFPDFISIHWRYNGDIKVHTSDYVIGECKDIPVSRESLCSRIEQLEKVNTGLRYQLDMMNTKISELNDTVIEKDKNLRSAADKIVQLTCANTTLKGQIDGLRLQLKAERKSYEDLEEDYDKKCADCINLANNVDSEVAKRMKAQEMLKTYEFEFYLREKAEAKIEELKKENATLQYRVDALQNDRKDLLSGYKKDLDNLNNEIKKLKQQIM